MNTQRRFPGAGGGSPFLRRARLPVLSGRQRPAPEELHSPDDRPSQLAALAFRKADDSFSFGMAPRPRNDCEPRVHKDDGILREKKSTVEKVKKATERKQLDFSDFRLAFEVADMERRNRELMRPDAKT